MRTPISNAHLQQLLVYIEHGYPIFPIHGMRDGKCTCEKVCASPGKHPITPHGFKDASTERAIVEGWIRQYPEANWGMSTGTDSRVLVVDIDRKSGGLETWEALGNTHPEPIETVICRTGNGGKHLWFQYPEGQEIRSGAGVLGPGVDIRANGGYVLVPPSQTAQAYEFELSITDSPLAVPPEWLLAMLRAGQMPTERKQAAGGLVPEGARHQELLSLAARYRNNGLGPDEMIAALVAYRDLHCASGDHLVSAVEIEAIVTWVMEQNRGYHLTDLGNAERFRDEYGERVRWCDAWGCWLMWNGKAWKRDEHGEVTRLAHESARSIYHEAYTASSEQRRKELSKHAEKSEDRRRVEAMLACAKPYLSVTPGELDNDPFLLNVQNGVLDLKTGELLPHDSQRMITKLIDVSYCVEAECRHSRAFLRLVSGEDAGIEGLLQRAVGYSLTGSTDEQCIFFLYGQGANGKSTFLESVRRLMGDYIQKTAAETLLESTGDGGGANPYMAQLQGARIALVTEMPENRKMNEALIKDLTGGEAVTARMLYKNPATFLPSHKLWIFGNYRPRISGQDEGIWRRIVMIPFNAFIPPKMRRLMSEVLSEFWAEKEGILKWAVQGCLDWQQSGLQLTEVVEKARKEYRSEHDLVGAFLVECCQEIPSTSILKQALYDQWGSWCVQNGEYEGTKCSKRWFTQQVLRKGFGETGHGRDSIRGLILKNKDGVHLAEWCVSLPDFKNSSHESSPGKSVQYPQKLRTEEGDKHQEKADDPLSGA